MSVMFDVWLVSEVAAGYLDDVLAGSGLSGADFGLYSLLHRFGPTTPGRLRRWTGRPATTISANLKRLERRGHLIRTPHPEDGRSYQVGLSAEGVSALERATEPFLAAMHALSARFVPDTLRERLVLQHLDTVIREVAGLDARPYAVHLDDGDPAVAHDRGGTSSLAYPGAPLTAAQERQVRLYIDFLRAQPTP